MLQDGNCSRKSIHCTIAEQERHIFITEETSSTLHSIQEAGNALRHFARKHAAIQLRGMFAEEFVFAILKFSFC